MVCVFYRNYIDNDYCCFGVLVRGYIMIESFLSTTFAYDAFQRAVSQTDGRGNTTQTVYDNMGRVASSIDALGYVTTYGYDALGRQVSEIDGRGNLSQAVYDEKGRLIKSIDGAGNVTTYTYDALGRRTSVTDPLTNAVTTAYDAEGRVVSVRGAAYPVDYAYDAYGSRVSMTTYRDEALANGDTTRWLLDSPSGLVTNKVYADGRGPSYAYTPDGRLARRTWARGVTADYAYDAAGNLMSTVYSDGTPTVTMAYDRVGNLVNATTAGVVTNLYAYDLYGHCTNEWQNDFQLTRYYDTLGRSTGYAINGTRQLTLAYDTYGRIVSMQIPAEEESNHHSQPQPSTSTSFTWTYLPGSDLKASLQYPNGLTASWSYDANNQLLQVRNATPTNIISQFDYTYDAAGRRTAIAKGGTAFGDLSGSIDSYAYNARCELTSARRTKNGQPIPGFSEDFDYDPIGNRRSSATYNEKGEAQTSTYEANNLNQYTTRTTPGYAAVRGEADPNAFVTVNENQTFRFGSYFFGSDIFDNSRSGRSANLLTYAVKEGVGQGVGVVGAGDDLVSSVSDQVYVPASPETFAYDDDGNQTLVTTATGRWRVTYNGENRPIRWELVSPDSNTPNSNTQTLLQMSYDHMGRRVTKNDQRFIYNGYLQIAEFTTAIPNSSFLLRNSYAWDPTERVATRPLAWTTPTTNHQSPTTNFYTHDGNKNVSEVIASDNAVAAHYEYAPFGAVILRRGESAAINPWRFSSEFADDELGCVCYNYRHYEPVTGRWLSRDPIGERGGIGLYTMCFNSCLLASDNFGLYLGWDDAVVAGCGFVAGLAFTGIGDWFSGEVSSWEEYLGNAVAGALFTEGVYLAPVGGVLVLAGIGAISSGTGNVVTQAAELLVDDREKFDYCDFSLSITFGAAFACLPVPNIPKINAGQGSFVQTARWINTTYKNGSLKPKNRS